nr:MAG TPA: hypothetical protein [Caudoviricetes sp.]
MHFLLHIVCVLLPLNLDILDIIPNENKISCTSSSKPKFTLTNPVTEYLPCLYTQPSESKYPCNKAFFNSGDILLAHSGMRFP